MQAQATGSGRFGFHRLALLALAIGALASLATTLVLRDVVELPFTAESQAVRTSAAPAMTRYDRMRFLEQNVQLPDGVLAQPAQSVERMRFLEQNVWEYAEAPATYQGLNAEHPYLSRLDYTFLEQNSWDVGATDSSTAPVGIHRDEGLNDGLGY